MSGETFLVSTSSPRVKAVGKCPTGRVFVNLALRPSRNGVSCKPIGAKRVLVCYSVNPLDLETLRRDLVASVLSMVASDRSSISDDVLRSNVDVFLGQLFSSFTARLDCAGCTDYTIEVSEEGTVRDCGVSVFCRDALVNYESFCQVKAYDDFVYVLVRIADKLVVAATLHDDFPTLWSAFSTSEGASSGHRCDYFVRNHNGFWKMSGWQEIPKAVPSQLRSVVNKAAS
jgi:hypothetical protein